MTHYQCLQLSDRIPNSNWARMDATAKQVSMWASEDGQASNPVPVPEPDPDRDYIRLEKTKCREDGPWGPEAEAKYKEFKKLHADQIEGHGNDNLTAEEVYSRVYKGSSGYIKGLGAGPRHPKKIRTEDELKELFSELQSPILN